MLAPTHRQIMRSMKGLSTRGLIILMLSELNILTGVGFYYMRPDGHRANALSWFDTSTRTAALLAALYWAVSMDAVEGWYAVLGCMGWYAARCALEWRWYTTDNDFPFVIMAATSQLSITNYIANVSAFPRAGASTAFWIVQWLLTAAKLIAVPVIVGFALYYPTYASAWHCYGTAAAQDRNYGYCPQYHGSEYLAPSNKVCRYIDDLETRVCCNCQLDEIAKSWQHWPAAVHSVIYVLLSMWLTQAILFAGINHITCYAHGKHGAHQLTRKVAVP